MNEHITIFGYARISTKEQHIDRQISALTEAGILNENIFTDIISGKDFERPQYKRMLKILRAGDKLKIKSLDRLGRNRNEINEQWRLITKDLGIHIAILDMPLLDTTNNRDLVGAVISDIVFQLLSFVAETERDVLLVRQSEGIAEAKNRGVKFGRPKKVKPTNFEKLKKDYKAKKISSRKAAERLNVPQSTFLDWVKEESD